MDLFGTILVLFFLTMSFVILVLLGIVLYKIILTPAVEIFRSHKKELIKKMKPLSWFGLALALIYVFSSFAKDLGIVNENRLNDIRLLFFSVCLVLFLYLVIIELVSYNWINWTEIFQVGPVSDNMMNRGQKNMTYLVSAGSIIFVTWQLFRFKIISPMELLLLVLLLLVMIWHWMVLKRKYSSFWEGVKNVLEHPLKNSKIFFIEFLFLALVVDYLVVLF